MLWLLLLTIPSAALAGFFVFASLVHGRVESAPHSKDDIAASSKRLLMDGPTAEDFEGLTHAVLLARPGMPEQ